MNTVALIFKDGDKVIIPYDVAVEQYERLNKLELVNAKDEELFAALVTGIGVLPKLPLGLMTDGRTLAETKIEEWKNKYSDLN